MNIIERLLGRKKVSEEGATFLREDRERRELRAERRGLKWLGARQKRAEKMARGLYNPNLTLAQRVERATSELEPGSVAERHLIERIEEERKLELLDAPDAPHPSGTEKPANMEGLDAPPRSVGEGLAKVLVKGREKRKGKLTPAERGGFTPTLEEYEDEIIPAYVSTAEEKARWLELRTAEREFAEACAKREARKGPAVCSGVGLLEKGHSWWKVPRQAEWECVECGENVPTMYFDKRRGRLVDIRGGMMGRHVRDGLARLAAGDDRVALLPGATEKTLGELREAARELGRLPAVFRESSVLRANDAEVIDMRDFIFSEEPGTYGVCANCGCAKSGHREEKVERGRTEQHNLPLFDVTLRCPVLSEDAR